MKAITSIDLAALQAIQAELDAQLGFPLEGTDIGAGVHAPLEQSRTLRRTDIIKHPTLQQWALPVDQSVADALVQTEAPALVAGGLKSGPVAIDVATPLNDALAAADLGPDWAQKAGPIP